MFRCKKSLFVFLLPGLLGVMIFYIIPFIGGIGYSLTDGRAALKIIGFANYTNVWNNPIFQLAFKNTILLSFLCAPIVWILSYLLALLTVYLSALLGLFTGLPLTKKILGIPAEA